jgi:hypothetical protein
MRAGGSGSRGRKGPGRGLHARLAAAVFALDRYLRRQTGVFEFTTDPLTIFRISIGTVGRSQELAGGRIRLAPGDRIVQLHLWNEHVPRMDDCSALGWARRMTRSLDHSFATLAEFLERRPDLADVKAVRIDMTFGTSDQMGQLARICRRFGFEPLPPEPPATLVGRLHLLGENMLIGLLVLARNAGAFRIDVLRRARTPAVLSRRALDERYGRPAASTAGAGSSRGGLPAPEPRFVSPVDD